MLRKNNYYQFQLLCDQPRLKHAVFTRHGGVSEGSFSSLNVGLSTGDNHESVHGNIKKIEESFGLKAIYSAHQCHGKEIWQVEPEGKPIAADIVTTSHRECPLMIKHADCQAAILYDPIQHAVSGVHSGWRGSVLNVYAKTVSHMQQKYGSKPENLLVGISPSLGPQSAEFIHYKKELPESFWGFQQKPNYFDFWQISRFQLEQCGVLPDHIEIAEIDTYTDDDFFSYRREKVTGRNGTMVCLS